MKAKQELGEKTANDKMPAQVILVEKEGFCGGCWGDINKGQHAKELASGRMYHLACYARATFEEPSNKTAHGVCDILWSKIRKEQEKLVNAHGIDVLRVLLVHPRLHAYRLLMARHEMRCNHLDPYGPNSSQVEAYQDYLERRLKPTGRRVLRRVRLLIAELEQREWGEANGKATTDKTDASVAS